MFLLTKGYHGTMNNLLKMYKIIKKESKIVNKLDRKFQKYIFNNTFCYIDSKHNHIEIKQANKQSIKNKLIN